MDPSNKYIFASPTTMAANETLRQAFKQQLIQLRENQESRDKLTTPEAISRIVNGKASIANIKKSIFLANKAEATEESARWFDPRRQQQMLSICTEACDLTKQQRQESMRSTEKNLSEMNDEILKMRKSLTDKGILGQGGEGQKDEQKSRQEQLGQSSILETHKRDEEEIVKRQRQASDNAREQKNEKREEDKKQENHESQEMIEKGELEKSKFENSEQNEQKETPVNEMVSEAQKKIGKDGSQTEQNQQKNVESNASYLHENSSTHSQPHEEEQPLSKVYINNKSFNRQHKHIDPIEEREGEESTILDQQSRLKTYENSESHLINQSQLGKQKLSNQILQKERADEQKPDQRENTNNEEKNSRKGSFISKKLVNTSNHEDQNTHRDNEFFDEAHSPKNNTELERSRIFRPKLSQNQRLISLYPPNFFSHCPTEHQKMYAKINFKLSKLFEHYIKEIKPTALTFDTIPKSLDLTTTLKYYKELQLNKLIKSGEISKIFKKFAVNGLWLEENGFFKMHEVVFEIPRTIKEDLQFCEMLKDKMTRIEKQKKQKEAREEERKIQKEERKQRREEGDEGLESEQEEEKQEEIQKISEEEEKKMDKIFHTLSRINDSYLPDEKVSKKLNIRFMSPKTVKHEFDVDKLRNIIKSHAGTSKQLVKKMNQQKKQQQMRHEMQVQRILEKYKNQNFPQHPPSQANSTKSLRVNHHRIDSYAQRNRIKKGGSTISTVKTLQDSHVRLKSETKLKPYFKERSDYQRSEILTQVSQVPSQQKSIRQPIENRIQVYRQLSLPKLPRRQMRDQSIYESLMKIDVKPELETIKSLVNNEETKEQDDFFNDFYAKERKKVVKEKQQRKKSPVQQRMKFT